MSLAVCYSPKSSDGPCVISGCSVLELLERAACVVVLSLFQNTRSFVAAMWRTARFCRALILCNVIRSCGFFSLSTKQPFASHTPYYLSNATTTSFKIACQRCRFLIVAVVSYRFIFVDFGSNYRSHVAWNPKASRLQPDTSIIFDHLLDIFVACRRPSFHAPSQGETLHLIISLVRNVVGEPTSGTITSSFRRS